MYGRQSHPPQRKRSRDKQDKKKFPEVFKSPARFTTGRGNCGGLSLSFSLSTLRMAFELGHPCVSQELFWEGSCSGIGAEGGSTL